MLREKPLSVWPLLLIAGAWEAVSRLGLFSRYTMPPFSLILLKLIEMLVSGELFVHIAATLHRVFVGFLIATALAIPLGILMGWSKKVYKVLEATIELLRPIPPISLIPLAILWFGIGDESKVFIIAFASFFPTLLNTMYGVRGVDDYLVRSAKTLGADTYSMWRKVVIPAALPYIFAGVRIGLSLAFMSLIAAEMVAANSGLGWLIIESEYTFHIREMYAALFTLIFLGLLTGGGLIRIENRLTWWHKAITLQREK